jgi:hypothetical protein
LPESSIARLRNIDSLTARAERQASTVIEERSSHISCNADENSHWSRQYKRTDTSAALKDGPAQGALREGLRKGGRSMDWITIIIGTIITIVIGTN